MIGRITNQMSAQMTLAGIESSLDRLDTTQQELSSGKSINQPSDNPSGTSLALQLNTQLSNLTSYSNNVTDGTGWATAQSSALSDITNCVQRIQELTTEAANGTQSTADMQASAQEVNQLIDQVKSDANTQYNGQYVFSGSATSTAPYASGTDDTYAGNTGQVTRTIGPNTSLTVSANLSGALGNGQTVSGQPAGDGLLLNTLRNVADDMQSGNSSAVNSDLSGLTRASTRWAACRPPSVRPRTGCRWPDRGSRRFRADDTQVLSNTQDADMATTEISYSTQQAALTAALQAGASIVQQSLMNFLGNN